MLAQSGRQNISVQRRHDGAANTGKEPYSEFYAAQIAQTMGIKHVDYNLRQWKGMLSSVCELFTDINTAYVPIGRFVGKDSLLAIAQLLKDYGEEFYNEFADMLVFGRRPCGYRELL